MHIPSERIYKEMKSEIASLWYVPANDGKETALLIKCMSPTVKALIKGCPFQLQFGKCGNFLCIGVKIQDMPDTPVLISGIQRDREEHRALIQSIKEKKFPLFLFNEMDVCHAWTDIELSDQDASDLIEFLEDEDALYVGPFDKNASFALDCFQFTLDNAMHFKDAHSIPTLEITPKVYPWTTNHLYFYGNEGFQEIEISKIDEGGNFENTVYCALGEVFPPALYQNPQVKIGNKIRELTDIFASHEYGSFLIEIKDLSVIKAGYERNQDRRISGIQQQIEKAIKQLTGAAKAFLKGAKIYNSQGNEIIVDRTIPPHCIILITELMNSGNWDTIVNHLIEAMKSTGAFFSVIDLQELMTILKLCSGDPKLIDYNLMKRCELSVKKKSIHVRTAMQYPNEQ